MAAPHQARIQVAASVRHGQAAQLLQYVQVVPVVPHLDDLGRNDLENINAALTDKSAATEIAEPVGVEYRVSERRPGGRGRGRVATQHDDVGIAIVSAARQQGLSA